MQLQVNFWDQAFQAAGFPAGTLHAEVCPEGIDPYDIDGTFSYVEWVHRCVQQLVGLGLYVVVILTAMAAASM